MNNLRQFEALFNYATIGIILCNKDAEIINFNGQAEKQFGYTRDELIGQKIEILIPNKLREKHIQYRNNFYDNPHHRIMGAGRDLNGQKKDGSTFPVEVSLSNYKADDETYVIAFVIDITIRKNNEVELYNQKTELEEITTRVRQMNTELELKVENRTKMLRETTDDTENSKEITSQPMVKELVLG